MKHQMRKGRRRQLEKEWRRMEKERKKRRKKKVEEEVRMKRKRRKRKRKRSRRMGIAKEEGKAKELCTIFAKVVKKAKGRKTHHQR